MDKVGQHLSQKDRRRYTIRFQVPSQIYTVGKYTLHRSSQIHFKFQRSWQKYRQTFAGTMLIKTTSDMCMENVWFTCGSFLSNKMITRRVFKLKNSKTFGEVHDGGLFVALLFSPFLCSLLLPFPVFSSCRGGGIF